MFKQFPTDLLMALIEDAHDTGEPVPVDMAAELGSRGIIPAIYYADGWCSDWWNDEETK